jgi:hypothetical protein
MFGCPSSATAPLFLLALAACQGGDPATETDPPVESDTPVDSDTDAGGAEEVWQSYEATPVRVTLSPARYYNTSFKWFNDAAEFEAWAGTPAPPELAARTHDLIVRTGRPGPFPGTWGDVLDLEASNQGRVRARVLWSQADAGCGVFDIPMPPAAAALIPPTPRAPRLQVSREDVDLRACVEGGAEGDPCTREDLCAPGLRCHGLTRGVSGFCRPVESGGVYELPGGPIPEGGAGLVMPFEVGDPGGTDEDVLVQLELRHPRPADLRVTIENPAGVVATVMSGASYPSGEVVDIGVFGLPGGQAIRGTWTLTILDETPGQAGEIGIARVEIGARPN